MSILTMLIQGMPTQGMLIQGMPTPGVLTSTTPLAAVQGTMPGALL